MNYINVASGGLAIFLLAFLACYIGRQHWTAFKAMLSGLTALSVLLLTPTLALAGEADLVIPVLCEQSTLLVTILFVLGMIFALYQYAKSKVEAISLCWMWPLPL